MAERDDLEHPANGLLDRRLRPFAHAQGEGDVLEDVEMREQRIVLEDDTEVALFRREICDVAAVDRDAPGIELDEAGDRHQRRRLAGAAEAEQGDELARRDVERDIVDRDEIAVALAEMADLDGGAGHALSPAAHQNRVVASVRRS